MTVNVLYVYLMTAMSVPITTPMTSAPSVMMMVVLRPSSSRV